jgi:dihydropyrimidinase
MNADLVIKGGQVVTAFDSFNADVVIASGKITKIGKAGKVLSGESVIDAKGKLVLPGGVDVHTHLDMPFMGTFSSDDFETGTLAAACGGTTSIVDFAMQSPSGTLSNALATWKNKAKGKASVDYGFHLGITDVNDSTLEELDDMVREGITSFKLFMAYKGTFMSDDEEILRVLEEARKLGAITMFHAENGHIIDHLTKAFLSQGKTEVRYHPLAHPEVAEEEATGRAISLARVARAPIYIVHLTCSGAAEKVRQAKEKGFPVFAETCPQYLLLSTDVYNKQFNESSVYVMSPPIRDEQNREPLWHALNAGYIQIVSTDHCPFYLRQKEMGMHDFSKIPNGAGGIETRIPLMYSEGVGKKKISLKKFVDACCSTPARLMGMYPQKGTIASGSDADLVIFDPKKKVTLSADMLHQRTDQSPFEGIKLTGYPEKVIIGGQLKVDDGEFIGEKGRGKFIKRNKFVMT